MTSKLTLNVEKTLIESAKNYARKTGSSLSELISKYLESLTKEDAAEEEISPGLKKIVGVVKLPDGFDEDTVLRRSLEKKHL